MTSEKCQRCGRVLAIDDRSQLSENVCYAEYWANGTEEGGRASANCDRATIAKLEGENAELRTERDEARALAVEVSKNRCQLCHGRRQLPLLLASDTIGTSSGSQTTPCPACSGTGLDVRVPKEWATGAQIPSRVPSVPPEPSREPPA